MSALLIATLQVLLNLLALDNAPSAQLDHPRVVTHLMAVAEAIAEAPAPYRVRLIALAYEESRFGYAYAFRGEPIKNGAGACGVYQQIPKFAEGGATTCAKLQDAKEATRQAVAYLRYVERRWKARSTASMDKAICHYFSGNRCDDKEALAYAKRHTKTRKKAQRLIASR